MNKPVGMRPLGVRGSLLLFIGPAIILYCAHSFFVPWVVMRAGVPYLAGYLIAWPLTMAFFLIAAPAGYDIEGGVLRWNLLASRFRLNSMTGEDWLWTIALLVVSMALHFGLGFGSQYMARIPVFAPHPLVPADFGPGGTAARVPGSLMGMQLSDNIWVAVVFIIGWLFNVFGKEFWFRGYLLPRQELAMEARTWIANGLMFGFNHSWQPWNLLLIVPGALIGANVVQRRHNTWILIIMHGLMNLALVAVVVLNVAGIAV